MKALIALTVLIALTITASTQPVSSATPVLTPIAGTQTLPPYPAISIRLGEQGTTRLKVTIGADGSVTNASIVKSSGSNILDQAAAQWVGAKYKWQPPTMNGRPVTATTEFGIVWDLKNAKARPQNNR